MIPATTLPPWRLFFSSVAPVPIATLRITPPSWAPTTNAVVHATAQLGPDAQREAGVTVGVG